MASLGQQQAKQKGQQIGEQGQYINPLTARVLNLNATLAFAGILLLGIQVYNVPEETLYLKFLPSPGAFLFGATLMWIVQILFIKLAAGKTN